MASRKTLVRFIGVICEIWVNYGNYRRDQIYFVEKNKYGASEIYSLVEYKEEGKIIRKDLSFEKDYIEGRYDAIPFIGNLSNVVKEWQEKYSCKENKMRIQHNKI